MLPIPDIGHNSYGDIIVTQDRPDRPETQDKLSFEEAFTRLGETTKALESGGLTLEAATDLYQEGMRLVRLCNHLLSSAELKITRLKDSYSDDSADSPAWEDL